MALDVHGARRKLLLERARGGVAEPERRAATEREGFLLRFDGETWKPVRGGEVQIVEGVWSVGRDAVLVGPALNGLSEIRDFDGDRFHVLRSEGRFGYRDVWRAQRGKTFVAGTNGFVLTGR